MAKGKRVTATGKGTLRFGDLLDEYWAAHGDQMGRFKTAGLALSRRRIGTATLSDMTLGKTCTDFASGREKDGADPAIIL